MKRPTRFTIAQMMAVVAAFSALAAGVVLWRRATLYDRLALDHMSKAAFAETAAQGPEFRSHATDHPIRDMYGDFDRETVLRIRKKMGWTEEDEKRSQEALRRAAYHWRMSTFYQRAAARPWAPPAPP